MTGLVKFPLENEDLLLAVVPESGQGEQESFHCSAREVGQQGPEAQV